MVAALVQSSTSGTTDSQASSVTVPVPAGAAAGHVAVLAVEIWLDTATDPVITWPSGFTQIAYAESTTDGFQRLYVARKVLTGADTGNYVPTWSGSYWTQGQCSLWSGIDNTTPLDVAVSTAVTAANTTMPAVSVTTVTAGCGMVHLVANENSATGTAPTGYTERQEANYLRTNTKVAGAAGAETPSGGSISVSTVKLGALVALRPAGGGGGNTTPAGTATETDTAQAVGRQRTTTVGTSTESDSAQPTGRARTTQVGTSTETDTAQGITTLHTTLLNTATETDVPRPIASQRTTTLGTATETDTGQAAGRTRTTTVGTAIETDAALAAGGGGSTPAGTAAEVDTALPVGRVRTTSLGAALEADTGLAAGHTRVTQAGTATETDTAVPVIVGNRTALGTALEVDAALPVLGPVPPTLPVQLAGVVIGRWDSEVRPNRYQTEVHA